MASCAWCLTIIKTGDQVEVEGTPIYNEEEKVYYLLNKPRGVISVVSDDKGGQQSGDLLSQVPERICQWDVWTGTHLVCLDFDQ